MSRGESHLQMLALASPLETLAGTSHLVRFQILAHVVGISFRALDLDRLVHWFGTIGDHPFRNFIQGCIGRHLNPAASRDRKRLSTGESCKRRRQKHLDRKLNIRVSFCRIHFVIYAHDMLAVLESSHGFSCHPPISAALNSGSLGLVTTIK